MQMTLLTVDTDEQLEELLENLRTKSGRKYK